MNKVQIILAKGEIVAAEASESVRKWERVNMFHLEASIKVKSRAIFTFPTWSSIIAYLLWRTKMSFVLRLYSSLSHIQQICSRWLCKHTPKKVETPFKWKYNKWMVENKVTKWEIASFEQFLLFLQCSQKAFCCRGVRKHLYNGKRLTDSLIQMTYDIFCIRGLLKHRWKRRNYAKTSNFSFSHNDFYKFQYIRFVILSFCLYETATLNMLYQLTLSLI